jgi:predicted ATPase
LSSRQTAAQLLLQFYCNTMTHEQCANMNVACWPYFPRMGSLVGALAEANHPGAFDRMEAQMQQLRAQHTAQANRRKQQLAQQRQDYWRRLVVLREQQALQQQALQAVAAQQQQLQQQQQFVVKPPVSMGLQF